MTKFGLKKKETEREKTTNKNKKQIEFIEGKM